MKEFIKRHLKRLLKNRSGRGYKRISYSQCGEDLIIEFIFNQLGIFKPTYLDIGAYHPFALSNTALFYIKGCRGINIEPDQSLFKELLYSRKLDKNLNVGIGEKESESDFFVMNIPTLNTFSLEQVELYKSEGVYFVEEVRKVQVVTIESVLQHNKGVFPDLLSLDAEGVDELIIKNIDFSNRPKVICVETLSFSDSGQGIKNASIINFIKENGYMHYADTYINSIFVDNMIWNKQKAHN